MAGVRRRVRLATWALASGRSSTASRSSNSAHPSGSGGDFTAESTERGSSPARTCLTVTLRTSVGFDLPLPNGTCYLGEYTDGTLSEVLRTPGDSG